MVIQLNEKRKSPLIRTLPINNDNVSDTGNKVLSEVIPDDKTFN